MAITHRGPGWYWTTYWGDGHTASCSQGAPGAAAGQLKALWSAFAQARPAGARVLDLATGGGQAAAWLLAAHPGLLVTGADFADLPAERPDAPGVTFVGGAPLEKLPFADNAFDGLISQFGFEYGERTASVREAARILAPGGHGLFLSHHDQSAITQDYEARGGPFIAALVDRDPLRPARRVFDLHRRGASATALSEAEARMRSAVAKAQDAMANAPPHAEVRRHVAYLQALAAEPARFEPSDALSRLDTLEAMILSWRLRYEAHRRAMMDGAGVQALAARMSREGLVVQPPTPYADGVGALLGWRIDFAKPA